MEQWWLLLETEFKVLNHELQHYLYDSFRSFAYKEVSFLLRDHALIEDVIQDAFLKATSKRQQIKNASSTKLWMKRVIRNTALDALKKSSKYRSMLNLENVSDIDTHFQTIINIADTVEANLRNQILHDSIMELKYEYRVLLWMYYIEEKPFKIIAQELGINEQVIAQRLVRARKKLFLQFSRKWVDNDD